MSNTQLQLIAEQVKRIEILESQIERLEQYIKLESLRKGKFLALVAPLADLHTEYPEAHLAEIKEKVRHKMQMFNWCFECQQICCEGGCHV